MASTSSQTSKLWDAYEELGVTKDASLAQIKAAFREKARRFHPDKKRNEGAEGNDEAEAFRSVRRAYEILADPEARSRYDDGKGFNDSSKGTVLEVDLDDMEYREDDSTYFRECRCSGLFEINEEQLEAGYDTVCCSSCSLYARILYEIIPDES